MPSPTYRGLISPRDNGTFDVACYRVTSNGEPIGDPEWISTGWPTKAAAEARAEEHGAEHKTGEPAPELVLSAARKAAH